MIELVQTSVSDEYKQKFNVHIDDFITIYKDGKQVSSQLYRIGGLDVDLSKPYFVLLKQVESRYPNNITTNKKKQKYLANCDCLIDQDGIEIITTEQYKSLYYWKGLIYSINDEYYNAKTGISYGYCRNVHFTDNFVFMYNPHKINPYVNIKGMLKIDVHTGKIETFN